MNREKLKQLYPNASESFLERNSDNGQADIQPDDTGPVAKLERDIGDGTVGKVPVQKGVGRQFFVLVTAYRQRLLDDDNCCEKYHVDLLRYAGIIPGDSRKTTRIECRQEKVKDGEPEEVKIEVFEL